MRKLTKEQRDELRQTAAEVVKERLHASAIVACRVEIPQLLDDLDAADRELEAESLEYERAMDGAASNLERAWSAEKERDELRAKLAEAEADITDLKKNYAGMRDTQRMLVIERDEAQAKLARSERDLAGLRAALTDIDTHAPYSLIDEMERLRTELEAMKSTLVRIRWDSNIAALHVAKMMANECLQKLGYAPPTDAEVWDIHAQGTKERQDRYNAVAPYEKECDELRAKLARKDDLIAEWKDEEAYWRKKDEELRAKLADYEYAITRWKEEEAEWVTKLAEAEADARKWSDAYNTLRDRMYASTVFSELEALREVERAAREVQASGLVEYPALNRALAAVDAVRKGTP